MTELRKVDPRTLKRREVNARYMEPAQFKRLVDNFKADGRPTGVATVCQNDDGSLEILSGHHRTEAAIAAGFDEVEVLVITTPLDEERKTAIQLSHNSISGQDNPSLLVQLYESLDLEAKKFSGLTDAVLKELQNVSVSALAAATVKYEELQINFLPEDLADFDGKIKDFMERYKNKAPKTLAARYADFDRIFDAIVRTKHKLAIVNSALALMSMAELAHAQLDQMEAEDKAAAEETAKVAA